MKESENKFCKNCGEKLKSDVEFCSKCGEKVNGVAKTKPTQANETKKKKMPVWAIVLIIIFGFIVIGAILDEDEPAPNGEDPTPEETVTPTEKTKKASESTEKVKKIEYQKVSIDTLEKELDENAAAAKDKYNEKFLEITGRLGTIDSDLAYISILSTTDEWDFLGVHCTITNDKQKEVIKTLKADQTVVVKGQITDVGEIMGYMLDIDEIHAK